jgi:hypothetical protein
MRRVSRVLTPANVIACVALFVALGGTGWAGQVIGHGAVGAVQLKASAVTTSKLASNSVTSSKLANGAVTKAKLAAGVVGGVDASKITKVDSPIAAVPANSTGTVVTATCPAGSKAVGGGWSAGLYADPLSEGPSPDGAGWTVSFWTGASPASVSVSAMCIAP